MNTPSSAPPVPGCEQRDYEKGYQQAVVDSQKHLWSCWFRARALAEDAVYQRQGLSPEQQGYADALDERYPGGPWEAYPAAAQ